MINLDYNILLEYLSIVGKGSWTQFKNYLNNINYEDKSINNSSTRSMLSRLGHIEFSFNKESGNIWSVTPPCINLIPNAQTGILSGYRTKSFLKRLREYCNKKNIDYISEENFEAPDCIKLNFKNVNDINDFELENNIKIQVSNNLPFKILNLFENIESSIKNLKPLEDFNAPEDYGLKMFNNTKKYGFDETPTLENFKNGLYEQKFYDERKYYLLLNGKWYNIEKIIGKFIYFHLNGIKNLIEYENKNIKIRNYIYFPELIDRALVNFSGHNPVNINGYLVYDNIDLDFANNLTIKLGQELGM